MRIKASISVKKGEGYIFRLHESEPEGFPKKFKVNFEEFNSYDGKDDQLIEVEDSSIESDFSKPKPLFPFRLVLLALSNEVL